MAELFDLNILDERQILHLMLNQLQLISIQLYRLHDIIAVAALQSVPPDTRGSHPGMVPVNSELNAILDYLEAGGMPYAASTDLAGDGNGFKEEQNEGSGESTGADQDSS